MAFLARLLHCCQIYIYKTWDILGISGLWWSSPNSSCFVQGDLVSGLVLKFPALWSSQLSCFFHFVNFSVYCSSFIHMGNVWVFFYSPYTTGEIQKMSAGFSSQICCNKNDTGAKVINEYWISKVDPVLGHFEHFCFGANNLLGLKCERLAGFLFFSRERVAAMWKYCLLCHIVKYIFFLFCKKSGEKPAFLFIQLVIPQGEDWRFSNILEKRIANTNAIVSHKGTLRRQHSALPKTQNKAGCKIILWGICGM